MKHAISWFEKIYFKLDYVILLQPTSPFRNIKTILKKCLKLFKKNSKATVYRKIRNK